MEDRSDLPLLQELLDTVRRMLPAKSGYVRVTKCCSTMTIVANKEGLMRLGALLLQFGIDHPPAQQSGQVESTCIAQPFGEESNIEFVELTALKTIALPASKESALIRIIGCGLLASITFVAICAIVGFLAIVGYATGY